MMTLLTEQFSTNYNISYLYIRVVSRQKLNTNTEFLTEGFRKFLRFTQMTIQYFKIRLDRFSPHYKKIIIRHKPLIRHYKLRFSYSITN